MLNRGGTIRVRPTCEFRSHLGSSAAAPPIANAKRGVSLLLHDGFPRSGLRGLLPLAVAG